MTYTPANWYWLGTPQLQVSPILYSSASGAVVPQSDANFSTWTKAGNTPSPWPKDSTGTATTAALDDLLANYGLPATGLTAPSAVQLFAHANAKVMALLNVSRNYTVPEGVISCDGSSSVANLTAIQIWGTANPTATQKWTDNNYAVFTLTGTDAVTFANAVLAYGQTVYATLATVAAAVKAGTIITFAAIDAEAWPV